MTRVRAKVRPRCRTVGIGVIMLLWLSLWLRLGLWLVLWLGLELWGGAVVSTGIRISIFYVDAEGVVLLCRTLLKCKKYQLLCIYLWTFIRTVILCRGSGVEFLVFYSVVFISVF